MMAATDWGDIEIDFEFWVNDFSNVDGLEITIGGGRHTNPQPFCEGCGYVIKFFYDGRVQLLKEQWHNNKVPVPEEDYFTEFGGIGDFIGNGTVQVFEGSIANGWVLCKFVRRILPRNEEGITPVQIEFWHNGNGDKQTFDHIFTVIDRGGWGSEGQECNGKRDQILNWRYPMVRFHWRNSDVKFYGVMVREIQPNAPLPEDPDDTSGGTGGGGGQPTIPPPEIPTGKVAKIGSFRFSIAAVQAMSCDASDPPVVPPQDPPDPPPNNPPPVGGGEFSIKLAEYFRVGSV